MKSGWYKRVEERINRNIQLVQNLQWVRCFSMECWSRLASAQNWWTYAMNLGGNLSRFRYHDQYAATFETPQWNCKWNLVKKNSSLFVAFSAQVQSCVAVIFTDKYTEKFHYVLIWMVLFHVCLMELNLSLSCSLAGSGGVCVTIGTHKITRWTHFWRLTSWL